MFLTSNLILCSIDGFTSGIKSQSIAYIPIESVHIYWILTFKVNCTQYGICSQAASKNARAMFFSKLAGRATIFGRVQNKSGKCHRLNMTPLKVCAGVFNVRSIRVTSHTRLRPRDHYPISTFFGGNGGASPRLLHTMLEGPTKYVNARWM